MRMLRWLIVLIAACLLIACASTPQRSKPEQVIEPAARVKPLFIEFYADWWEKCLRVKPVVSRLEAEFGDRMEFRQLDIDDPRNDGAKRRYGFRAQPQVVIVDESGKIVMSRLSELTYVKLKNEIQRVLDECRQRTCGWSW